MAKGLEKLNSSFLFFDTVTRGEAKMLWNACKKSDGFTYIGFKALGILGARGIETEFLNKSIDFFGSKRLMRLALYDAFNKYFLNDVKIILTLTHVDIEGLLRENLQSEIMWSLAQDKKTGKYLFIANGLHDLKFDNPQDTSFVDL